MFREVCIGASIALVVVAFAGVGSVTLKQNRAVSLEREELSKNTDMFIERAQGRVIAHMGQPIEGFEPFMFLAVFPGLEARDFDGVDALIGTYQFRNDELTWDAGGEPELHSAARAISDAGMRRLYENIGTRLGIELNGAASVDEVLAALKRS